MRAPVDVPWAVTPEKVQAVVRRLIEVAQPQKIILFGSYVRGEVNRDSDLDVMVVTDDDVANPHAESVRLRRSVRDIGMPMDILVVRASEYVRLRHRWDLIYHEVAENGQLVYERPAAFQ